MEDLYEKARDLAAKAHKDQTYSGEPYTVHLDEVEAVLVEHGFDDEVLRALAQLHDIIEDTPLDEALLAKKFQWEIGHVVQLLSDVDGPSRRIRKRLTYAKMVRLICEWEVDPDAHKMWLVELAVLVKLADRIANLRRSHGTDLMKMYRKERDTFWLAYYSPEMKKARALWITYESLLK